MVKNITGGNKSKKQARSSGGPIQQNKNVRKAIEEGEIYAVVTKINGGNNCQVMCNDGISRCCFIRNKFKTFGKRENTISIGCWILAGIRLWESRSSGVQKCDLLEVYSAIEKDNLRQYETCSFNNLLNAIESDRSSKSVGGVVFSNTVDTNEIESYFDPNEEDNANANANENHDKDFQYAEEKFKKEKPKSLNEILNSKSDNKTSQNDWLKENIDVDDI